MDKKELKKLTRLELVDLLIALRQENEALRLQIQALQSDPSQSSEIQSPEQMAASFEGAVTLLKRTADQCVQILKQKSNGGENNGG